MRNVASKQLPGNGNHFATKLLLVLSKMLNWSPLTVHRWKADVTSVANAEVVHEKYGTFQLCLQ